MKKFFLILSAGTLFLLTACSDKKEGSGGMSDKAKKNLEAHRGVGKAIETGDHSKLDDYLAEDVVDHAAEGGPVKGRDNVKALFVKYKEMSSDSKSEAIKELADDDYVMAWMKFTGVSNIDGMGMKKGEKYEMTSIEVSKYKDGKVTDHWTFMDPAEMMKMMGGGQQPPIDNKVPPAKDTTSK